VTVLAGLSFDYGDGRVGGAAQAGRGLRSILSGLCCKGLSDSRGDSGSAPSSCCCFPSSALQMRISAHLALLTLTGTLRFSVTALSVCGEGWELDMLLFCIASSHAHNQC
jgi:hypothetical protein